MKILILKIGAIGDVVMASSMITAIDEKYPGAEITWICGRIVEPILSSFGRINKIISIDEEKFYRGTFLEKFGVVLSVWKLLAGKKYKIVLNCYQDKRYKLFLLPVRYELYKDLGKASNFLAEGKYHADEYARMITNENEKQSINYKFPKAGFQTNDRLKKIIENIASPKIVLAPGGTKNILRQDDVRRWPIKNYVRLAKELIDRNISVILIGAETDKWVLNDFSGIDFTDLVGKTTFADLIQLFNGADILISHDTGTLHLAKLSDINIIALFGPVNPNERVGTNERVEVLWGGSCLSCSPCYDGREFPDCKNNICMQNIRIGDVINKINSILNSSTR